MKPKIILVLMALISSPLTAFAAGIQVSPSSLEITISDRGSATKDIAVANPTADVQLFEVYADDLSNAIKANPSSFTLEAGGRRTVTITVDSGKLDEKDGQTAATNLSVVSKPLSENAMNVGTGVKLPITINIKSVDSPALLPYQLAIALAALVAIAALSAYWYYRRTRN